MSDLETTSLELRRDFVLEALDHAVLHIGRVQQFLFEKRDELAISRFELMMAAVRTAATELSAIKAALPAHDGATGEAAAEHREQRGPMKSRVA